LVNLYRVILTTYTVTKVSNHVPQAEQNSIVFSVLRNCLGVKLCSLRTNIINLK